MAVIDIRRRHGRSVEDAKAAVERVAAAIGREYGISHRWDGDALRFSRTGVAGKISVENQDVHVRAELGFLMATLKPVIEREILRKLTNEFGEA